MVVSGCLVCLTECPSLFCTFVDTVRPLFNVVVSLAGLSVDSVGLSGSGGGPVTVCGLSVNVGGPVLTLAPADDDVECLLATGGGFFDVVSLADLHILTYIYIITDQGA